MINFETDINDPFFDEPVEAIRDHINGLGVLHFINAADNAEHQHHLGMQYALVGSGEEASKKAAVVMPAPFGNGVWPHIIARAEAVAYQLGQEGVRDSEGNPLPVLVTASPSMNSTYGLHPKEYADVARGNFAPLANRHIDLMKHLNISEMRGFIGYSLPAAIAAPTVQLAKWDLDVYGNVFIGDPAHSKSAHTATLLARFGFEGMSFAKEVKKEAIDVIDVLFDSKQAARQFNKGVIKRFPESSAIVQGLAQGGLRCDLSRIVRAGVDTTLMHASKSRIAPRKDVIAAYEHVRTGLADSWAPVTKGFLSRQEIVGTNHAFGDRIGRFAVLAAKAVV